MSQIEQYFDAENWSKFSLNFKSKENDPKFIELVSELENDIELANVIYEGFESESLKWINEKIPALDNLTPKECLINSNLKNRLKECLMRMPR